MAGDTVTKEELNDLYSKINQIAIDLAIIKTRMETWPQPEPRPCVYFAELMRRFESHVKEQDDQKGNWKRAMTASIVHVAEISIIGLVVYWISNALK